MKKYLLLWLLSCLTTQAQEPKIQIFPEEDCKTLVVIYEENIEGKILISDIQGRLMYESPLVSRVDISTLPTGAYYCVVTEGILVKYSTLIYK